MEWNRLAVDAEMGVESFPCSICRHAVTDLIFWPKEFEDLDKIGVREDCGLCEDCMHSIEDCISSSVLG